MDASSPPTPIPAKPLKEDSESDILYRRPIAKNWLIWQSDEGVREAFAKRLGIHTTLAHLLIQRGMTSVEEAQTFLNPSLDQMHDPFLMLDMKEAVDIVLKALEHGEQIVVHGDYDVDGISSAAVTYEFLKSIGAEVSFFIPRRDKEGYGLNVETIRKLRHEGAQLLITTDCGISNHTEIAVAKSLGLKSIIVDHHTVPEVLPPADAILNPLRPGCEFPFKQLAAVGVAFNFVVALRTALRARGIFKYVPEPDLRSYLDLVALGTIADVVPLVDENRIFARFGLEVLSKRQRAGVSALIERACNDVRHVTAQTVSFQIAPRLNAAGRMGDASICVELLTTRSYARAMELATVLEGLNKERQVTERDITRQALVCADELVAKGHPILVVAGQGWNRGVLGIVASRLMERHNRPAILIGIDENNLGKGSARSANGINLIQALGEVSDLLESYGGHTAAAGVALSGDHVEEFRRRLVVIVQRMLEESGNDLTPELQIDGELPLTDIDEQLMRQLDQLAPFGMHNPEPVFVAGPVAAIRARVVGKKHLRARFVEGNCVIDAIGFSMGDLKPKLDKMVWLAFVPKRTMRRGQERIEMHIKGLRTEDGTYKDQGAGIEDADGTMILPEETFEEIDTTALAAVLRAEQAQREDDDRQ